MTKSDEKWRANAPRGRRLSAQEDMRKRPRCALARARENQPSRVSPAGRASPGVRSPVTRENAWPHALWRSVIQEGSRPISRVLSRAVIPLGYASPRTSSDLPGSSCGHTQRSPIRSCSGWGLPCRRVLPPARCALTAPFHPCLPLPAGGLFSVALSVGSRLPGVTWHPAQRSPDFPPGLLPATARPTPVGSVSLWPGWRSGLWFLRGWAAVGFLRYRPVGLILYHS